MRYVLPFLVYSVHKCSYIEHKLTFISPNVTYTCDMISYTSRLEMFVNEPHASEKKLKTYCDILTKEMQDRFDASVDCHRLS